MYLAGSVDSGINLSPLLRRSRSASMPSVISSRVDPGNGSLPIKQIRLISTSLGKLLPIMGTTGRDNIYNGNAFQNIPVNMW